MPERLNSRSLVDLYSAGIITGQECVCRLIEWSAEGDVGLMISQLPADLLAILSRRVAEAPTSEEGWVRTFSFGVASIGPPIAEGDPEQERARKEAAGRAGVEVLRRHFGAGRG